ncbi:MAG: hypothetical protein AUH89_01400 [Ktedonobacter sp. 13_1_40CM_4_52_4]|nr:MAG: hypothetical protein AUH89_01400 [Ktedonobacter sp. 13_1_40CM_4_52_4]
MGICQLFAFVLHFFAPGKDFLIFSMYLVPVNGMYYQLCPLLFQVINHCVSGVEKVPYTGAGAAA